MIFKILSTNQTLWFPTASLNNAPPNYPIFFGLEVILNIFCLMTSMRCAKVLLYTGVVHLNMSIVLCQHFVQWWEIFIAKAILLPYQYGLVKVDGSFEQRVSSWWTLDPSEMVPAKNFQSIIYLYIASFLQWHYVFSLFLGMGGIIIERLAATIYAKDYEQKSRKHIPVLLIISTHLFSIPMAFQAIQIGISIQFFIGIMFIFMPTFMIAFLLVVRLNKHLQTYTLSQKFQIRENLRALVMMRKFIGIMMIYILFGCSLFYCLVFKYIQDPTGLLNRFLESFIYLNPICGSFSIMYCSDVWWEEFIGFHIVKRRERRRISVIPDETSVYFGQLKSAWA